MTQGLLAEIRQGGVKVQEVLIIGQGVPRIHHADRVPVYMVVEHQRGSVQTLKDRRTRVPLLAYPSSWPAPGARAVDRYIFAEHAQLTWSAPVPIYDVEPGRVMPDPTQRAQCDPYSVGREERGRG